MSALHVSCSAPTANEGAGGTRYALKGKVVAIDKPAKQLTVDHETIPGLMGAMTMPYYVPDERALENLSPGDQITATLVSRRGLYWLEKITPAKSVPPQQP